MLQNLVDAFFAFEVTENTVMAHLYKTFWEDMLLKTTQELSFGKHHGFGLIAIVVVLVLFLKGL